MNLIQVMQELGSEEQCWEFLENTRWPKGVRCVTCGSKEISTISRETDGKNKRGRIYQCLEPTCKQQFSATAGTIFHDSHLPLTKWFLAVALITNAKKGISAKQLQRDLKVSYQTAWHMSHRIRKSMEEQFPTKLSGVVEVDETFIGGKTQRRHKIDGRTWRERKDIVIGMRERDGRVRYFHVSDLKAKTLKPLLDRHISAHTKRIMTDSAIAYDFAMDKEFRRKHRTVNHVIEWLRPDALYPIHTNTVESSFSLLKRGLVGSFHRVSVKHLARYLSEFEYRFNRRDQQEEMFRDTVSRMLGVKPLPYAQLTANDGEDELPSQASEPPVLPDPF